MHAELSYCANAPVFAMQHRDFVPFTFLHAADLHIDSLLAGLSLKHKAVAARFAQADGYAVEALVQEAIAGKAASLIIADDIFDGDWKDVTAGRFFVRALSSLHRKNILVFMVKDNRDAASPMNSSRSIPPAAAADSILAFSIRRFADREATQATRYLTPMT